jgi:hypothetical protein
MLVESCIGYLYSFYLVLIISATSLLLQVLVVLIGLSKLSTHLELFSECTKQGSMFLRCDRHLAILGCLPNNLRIESIISLRDIEHYRV